MLIRPLGVIFALSFFIYIAFAEDVSALTVTQPDFIQTIEKSEALPVDNNVVTTEDVSEDEVATDVAWLPPCTKELEGEYRVPSNTFWKSDISGHYQLCTNGEWEVQPLHNCQMYEEGAEGVHSYYGSEYKCENGKWILQELGEHAGLDIHRGYTSQGDRYIYLDIKNHCSYPSDPYEIKIFILEENGDFVKASFGAGFAYPDQVAAPCFGARIGEVHYIPEDVGPGTELIIWFGPPGHFERMKVYQVTVH